MCTQSLNTKMCSNMNNGERCKTGWHIKGTVPENSGNGPNVNANQNGLGSNGSQNQRNHNSQNGSVNHGQDFLSSMVRREMGIVLREIFQTPNPQPNPQVKNLSGREYLLALLGNNPL